MKKFTFLMAMLLAMVMNLDAQGTRTIYLDANIWASDNPVFAAWVWNTGDADAQGYHFTLVEGTIYKAEIRDDATQAIFVRKDPNAEGSTTGVWEGEWNRAQTAIPADKNMFRVTSWEEPCGVWMTYGESVEYATHKLYVNNQTGWEVFDIYAYGNLEAFGGWPGATTAPTEVKDGVTYSVYEFQVEKATPNLNLIIHNNVGEGAEGDKRLYFTIDEARDYYLTVSEESVVEGPSSDVGTSTEPIQSNDKAVKKIVNGQLIIQKGNCQYTILGVELK